MSPRPAVFFDRDGVLNVDHGYVCSPERFEFVPGAVDAVRWLNDQGILAIVVSNQSGIARGIFSEAQCESFMEWVQSELSRRGARLDAWYICPHHPDYGEAPYRADCDCRKPKPGLLLRAIREHGIDPSKSILIGDSQRDLEAARAAGIRAYLYTGGRLDDFVWSAAREAGLATAAEPDGPTAG